MKIYAHAQVHASIKKTLAMLGFGRQNIKVLPADEQGRIPIYGHGRDPLLYRPEMSKRSRAIELWATMKYLGKAGIDQMVSGFNQRARQLGAGLQEQGYELLNEVVFNQVLVAGRDEAHTRHILEYVQQSGELWCGGTIWQGQAAIRISVCSWVTNEEDIRRVLLIFQQAFGQ